MKTTTAAKPRLGTRGQPEESRAAILRAAVKEFAEHGVAGARTDAIAHAAGVNKALLYYYFQDKETLYGAVLDQVFTGLRERVFGALGSETTPREKILAYVCAYFDFLANNPLYPRLVQREMMQAGQKQGHMEHLVNQYFRPIFNRLKEVLTEGIDKGEFRPVDPVHFIPSMIAMIVQYFASAPVMQMMMRVNPLSPERIAERRAAVIDFISTALFRAEGERK
ncbi:MAG TPA: TetR/AcrR family transcriptional regulator [Terriglobales bacterium]|nr:TetR/AcrR family transcriptional regulator [Terriglobales bacterium]